MDFKIISWNIAGSRHLLESEKRRTESRRRLNQALRRLIQDHQPEIITLQEVVRYGKSSTNAEDIIENIPNYNYYSFSLIDSDSLSVRAKWDKIQERGGWPTGTYFAQGNAVLLRENAPHFPIWNLAASSDTKQKGRHFIEQVRLESGLYFGSRDSEPRAARVAHLIYKPKGKDGKPLDIFVVNLHLTTLTMEREGIPAIDAEATGIRFSQLEIVFNGIISRYNTWRQQGYPERGVLRNPEEGESFDRYPPVWILAGDFNFTPNSEEYEAIMRRNFIDAVPHKGRGTKAKGAGNLASLTVDYIFAGPRFISLDSIITEQGIRDNYVERQVKVSDHYPLIATIPIATPEDYR